MMASVLLLATTQLRAQEAEPTQKDSLEIPKSILRIGYSPINTAQSPALSPGITIDWEKPLTPRFTIGGSLYRDLSTTGSYDYDEITNAYAFTGVPEYNDIRTSLSFSLNYYFKAYAYDGFYLSYRANNVISQVRSYRGFNAFSGGNRGDSQLISNPRRGVYLGYRKVFDNGMFIDGSAGYAPGAVDHFSNSMHNSWLDVKLTLGWQLDWNKLKKKKKKR